MKALAALLFCLPTLAQAQSAWDRNSTYTGYYVCESEQISGFDFDKATGKWSRAEITGKRTYNIDVVHMVTEDPRYEAIASQYAVRWWEKDKDSRSCLQLWNTTAHEYNTVTIERSGQLDCMMEGDNGSVDPWVLNFKTGRYLRVRDDGFVDGSDGNVVGPQLEIGFCRAQ